MVYGSNYGDSFLDSMVSFMCLVQWFIILCFFFIFLQNQCVADGYNNCSVEHSAKFAFDVYLHDWFVVIFFSIWQVDDYAESKEAIINN
jgi:uncharacterized membrane protein